MKASMDSLAFSIFLFIVYFIIFTFDELHGSPIDVTTNSPDVNQRYVTRRPSTETDGQYIEEYVDIVYTQRKSTAIVKPLSGDQDVDKSLNCDLNSESDECTQYWAAKNSSSVKEILDQTIASTVSVQETDTSIDFRVTSAEILQSGLKFKISNSSNTITASRIINFRSTLDLTTTEVPFTKPTSKEYPTLIDEDMYRILDISSEYNCTAESDYNDYDDEEDLYDQNPNTTTTESSI